MNSSCLLPVWTASPLLDPTDAPALPSPAMVDSTWTPLAQSWRNGEPDPAFQPGWARVRWHETGLRYDVVFLGVDARNSARHLNERTWELGDVGEIFLQAADSAGYLEIHVTPENVRLQLLWSRDGLACVRNNTAKLTDFMISQPDWVQSEVVAQPGFWAFQITIPASCLGLSRLQAGQLLRTAVCRYHWREGEPVLSSTARLPIPFFHHREGWHQLLLVDTP